MKQQTARQQRRRLFKRALEKSRMSAVAADTRILPPAILPGVVPSGRQAPAVSMAMDSGNVCYGMNWGAFQGSIAAPFPGFSALSMLATRAEYRQLAEKLANEITRKGVKFKSKSDEGSSGERIKQLDEKFRELGVMEVIKQAATDDCFFGRAQIFFELVGQDRATPLILSPNTVPLGSFKRLTTVEAIWTTPATYNALDPAAPDFYRPTEWFMLGQQVHASRLSTIVTRKLPDILKPAYNFAGMSLSQLAEPYVNNWLRTRQSVADLVDNFSTTILATDMSQVLQDDDDGADLLDRADFFTLTRSNKGLMLLDKEREEILQVNTPLSGLHELQAATQEHMCSVSSLPAIVLTGISPSGLNATSEGEIRVFYDWIGSLQTNYWLAPVELTMKLIQLSEWGEIDPNITVEYNPLYEMTQAELADIRLKDAQAGTAYIAAGVIDPSEERERLARDTLSGYQGLDTDVLPVPPAESDEQDMAAADKSVSEAQHKAMGAAAHGHSTLGIPENVGREFVDKDAE